MRRAAVLFDLDGTLIDSGPMIMASARYAARTVLGRELDAELDDAVRATIGGPGLVAMMETIEPTRVEALVAAYREENERLHDTLEAFDDVLAVLPRLREGGRRLGIVTAKRRATVALAFERFPALAEQTEVLVGAEDTELHKPHPDPVLEGLARLGVDATRAAYVGDSPFDIAAARAAGTLAVGVAWGGIHAPEVLAEAGADVVVRRPEELLDVV
ncbi:MAG: HAD-IA family hydrolase [Gaiella sp.]